MNATRDTARLRRLASAMTLSAGLVWPAGGEATPKRSDLDRRQQTFESMDRAADQRAEQARETADRQRQLLEYQIRKNQRMQLRTQCQIAGGGASC